MTLFALLLLALQTGTCVAEPLDDGLFVTCTDPEWYGFIEYKDLKRPAPTGTTFQTHLNSLTDTP